MKEYTTEVKKSLEKELIEVMQVKEDLLRQKAKFIVAKGAYEDMVRKGYSKRDMVDKEIGRL